MITARFARLAGAWLVGGAVASAGLAPALPATIEPARLLVQPGAEYLPPEIAGGQDDGDVPVTVSVGMDGGMRCTASGPAPPSLRRLSCTLIADHDVLGPVSVGGVPQPTRYLFLVRWSHHASDRQFGGAVPIGRDHWVTNADRPPIAYHNAGLGRVSIGFDINERGRIENCRVVQTNATEALAGAICPLVRARAAFLPALGDDKRPRRSRGWLNTEWTRCIVFDGTGCPSPDTGA